MPERFSARFPSRSSLRTLLGHRIPPPLAPKVSPISAPQNGPATHPPLCDFLSKQYILAGLIIRIQSRMSSRERERGSYGHLTKRPFSARIRLPQPGQSTVTTLWGPSGVVCISRWPLRAAPRFTYFVSFSQRAKALLSFTASAPTGSRPSSLLCAARGGCLKGDAEGTVMQLVLAIVLAERHKVRKTRCRT